MPEGLDFEELSSDHLFSLDLDTLRSMDDVRPTFFFLLVFIPNDPKANHGLR